MQSDDSVSIAGETIAHWVFESPATAQTRAGATTEMVERCEALFSAFDDFVVPQCVRLGFRSTPEDGPLPGAGADVGEGERREHRLTDADGVDVSAIAERAWIEDGGVAWLLSVRVDETKVKLSLPSGDRYVDRSSDVVVDSTGDPLGTDVLHDPLDLWLRQVPDYGDVADDSERVFQLYVRTYSDVWFTTSDQGDSNRRRLGEFLRRIDEALPETTVHRDSDRITPADLEAIW